jgi:energy-coupling factor transport system ATP-binding protein
MQIKTLNLSHTFDKGLQNEFEALNDVSLFVDQGEFITIIGETGSGKTTFIEHLNGLLRPSSGKVEIYSQEIARKMKKNRKLIKKNLKIPKLAMSISPGNKKLKEIKLIRKQVGIVFQFAEYQLFEETILKDIIFGPTTMGTPKEEAIELAKKYIKLVGMSEKFLERSPFALSGGQKRRVALAGILAMEPDILIFDEPTAGLDPQGEKDMYKIFHKLHNMGKTIIIVTHNMDLVLEHSNRTVVFKNGTIIRDDNSIDIMYDENFLLNNDLKIPKIVDLVIRLNKKGKKINKPKNINELVEEI